jgi:Na+-transporting methylmalonyl-CoA/oxaloacetate decarboxylase gamma subunit
MLGMPTWPPPDTDRNRFLFRLGFPIGVLASAYVLVFALVSNGWLPFVVAVLLIAVTLMLGIGLLLMRAQRLEGRSAEPETPAETAAAPAPDEPVVGGPPPVTPRPRPRPAPTAR